MTPEELATHLGSATAHVRRHEVVHGEISVWIDPSDWEPFARHLRDCGLCHFDSFTFLTAVDLEAEGLEVVLHVYSVRRQHHVNAKTVVPHDGALRTLSGVWLGADWSERETWEQFGVTFDGHPNLEKLLLPVEFEGYPLRKDFLLMSREIKEWPGLKEPEETKQ